MSIFGRTLIALVLTVLAYGVGVLALNAILLIPTGYYQDRPYMVERPCDRLPSADAAERTVALHQADWERLRRAVTYLELDTYRCPGKSELLIYGGEGRNIPGRFGPSFHGVPYSLLLD